MNGERCTAGLCRQRTPAAVGHKMPHCGRHQGGPFVRDIPRKRAAFSSDEPHPSAAKALPFRRRAELPEKPRGPAPRRKGAAPAPLFPVCHALFALADLLWQALPHILSFSRFSGQTTPYKTIEKHIAPRNSKHTATLQKEALPWICSIGRDRTRRHRSCCTCCARQAYA